MYIIVLCTPFYGVLLLQLCSYYYGIWDEFDTSLASRIHLHGRHNP